MSDEKKPVDAGDANVDADALAKKVADLEAKLAAVDADREKELKLRQEAIADRDKAKAERRALEEAGLAEQGKYKELYEKTLAELDELRPKLAELEPIKSKYDETVAQLKAKEEAERAAILETIPEGEERDKWKDDPLDVLRKIAPHYASRRPDAPLKPPAAGGYRQSAPDFSELTELEQIKYAREHNMTAAEIVAARAKARKKR